MDKLQPFEADIVKPLGLDVDHLAGDESLGADGSREFAEGADDARRGGTDGGAGDVLEGECEERVAGEDSDVLPEDLVVGRLTAAEVVVVHAGEVVVDKGHGVDHLNGAGSGHRGGGGASNKLAGGDAEDGAHALAAGEEGVAHGLVDPQRLAERNGVVKRLVDGVGFLEHVGLEVKRRLLFRLDRLLFGEHCGDCERRGRIKLISWAFGNDEGGNGGVSEAVKEKSWGSGSGEAGV